MEFPVIIPLKRPITVDGTTYDTLAFDEPDLGTSIAIEESDSPTDQTLILLSGMSGVDRSVILKIKESDFREITERVLEPYQASVIARGAADAGNGTAAK